MLHVCVGACVPVAGNRGLTVLLGGCPHNLWAFHLHSNFAILFLLTLSCTEECVYSHFRDSIPNCTLHTGINHVSNVVMAESRVNSNGIYVRSNMLYVLYMPLEFT